MQTSLKQRRLHETKVATLLGEPIIDPLGHLSAHYPFPARLTDRYVAALKASHAWTSFSKGENLFEEGESVTGVYIVLEGRAKLSINSAQGKTLVLGIFGPGTILGLATAILGRAHVATAEILKPTKVIFVPRKELIRDIGFDAMAALQVAELVSEEWYFIMGKIRAVDLSQSAAQKLARCLLGLLADDASSGDEAPAKLDLSQEAIAQMVGLSRETVTRLLSRFHTRNILNWKRTGIVIRDRDALEKLADFSEAVANLAGSAVTNSASSPPDEFSNNFDNSINCVKGKTARTVFGALGIESNERPHHSRTWPAG
ncbi:MAG: Crp/Fnr family transcriptional regulator [Candidatus Acidiferrales bacterium]|jgi:CRP/FNR family cyclic AMP-dependent transcriptional regulator